MGQRFSRGGATSKLFGPEFAADAEVTADDFEVVDEIGAGSFGRVVKVKKKDTGEIFAMKVLFKKPIMKQHAVNQSKAENKIQTTAGEHPFIVNLRYAWQSKNRLYIVLDYVPGGDLFAKLEKLRRFDNRLARFYVAEIAIALDAVHALDVVFRDLKLENVLLDADGHVRLTDFGLSKQLLTPDAETVTICGTTEYMAPEILKNERYSKSVDWWSLGIILYTMLAGKYPFRAATRLEMYEKILNWTSEGAVFPDHFPASARSIIKALLQPDPAKRLCSLDALKAHPYFKGLDFDDMYAKKSVACFLNDFDADVGSTGGDNVDDNSKGDITGDIIESEEKPHSEKQRERSFSNFSMVADDPLEHVEQRSVDDKEDTRGSGSSRLLYKATSSTTSLRSLTGASGNFAAFNRTLISHASQNSLSAFEGEKSTLELMSMYADEIVEEEHAPPLQGSPILEDIHSEIEQEPTVSVPDDSPKSSKPISSKKTLSAVTSGASVSRDKNISTLELMSMYADEVTEKET